MTFHVTAAMLKGRNNSMLLHKNTYKSQGRQNSLFCISTWQLSRGHAKSPLVDLSFLSNYTYGLHVHMCHASRDNSPDEK